MLLAPKIKNPKKETKTFNFILFFYSFFSGAFEIVHILKVVRIRAYNDPLKYDYTCMLHVVKVPKLMI